MSSLIICVVVGFALSLILSLSKYTWSSLKGILDD